MTTASAALAAALALAAEGFPSFPCALNKAPTCPRGFKVATIDPQSLGDLWHRHPGQLVGVPTGPISGLAALDIDAKHAEAHAWWRTHRHRIPETRTHRTRSGGLHLLFEHVSGLRCSAGRIAPGIDVRAEGGYILWWPGAGEPVLCDAAPAPWPQWLANSLQPASASPVEAARTVVTERGVTGRYAAAALRRAAQNVSQAREGQRNDKLNRETFSLLRLPELSWPEIAATMARAAQTAGLPDAEIVATLSSAADARRRVQ